MALAVVVLATLTRLPSLVRTEPLNNDEAFLATEANVLVHGGRMYEDVVDRKPPLVPYLVAAAQWATGTTALLPLRVLALTAHIATALLLAAIARRRWGDQAAWLAALLYVCASVGLNVTDAQAASFEAFMLSFTAAAYLLAQRERPLAAGVASAGAALCKQVGGAVLAPVALLAWRAERRRGLALVAIGFGVTVATVAAAVGWGSFWFWNVTTGWRYADPAGSGSVVLRAALYNTRDFVLGSAPLVVLAALGWRRRREEADLWLWLGASALGVAAGLHFFGHYYLQLLAPLTLLAASSASRFELRLLRPAVATTALIASTYTLGGFIASHPLLDPYGAIVAEVNQLTSPSDRIFVWGQFPQVYWASQREPATRFLTAGFLSGYSGGRTEAGVGPEHAVPGAWQAFAADLSRHPPEVIVVTTGTGPAQLIRFPVVLALLRSDYHLAAYVDGVSIYQRINP